MNSSKGHMTHRQNTFKQVDVGQKIVLNDDYMVANHRNLQMEAIALKTMENAERSASQLVEAARQEAQQILAAANEKAVKIVEEDGHQQRDAILKQGFEEGFNAGLEQGIMRITQEMAEQVMMADRILDKAFEAERLLLEQHQQQLIEIMRAVLKLILTHEIETTPAQMASLIHKASEQLQATGGAKIIINPETLQVLKECSTATMAVLTESHRLRFVPDAACGPMELYLETIESSYDISPLKQAEIYLKNIEQHIVNPSESSPAEAPEEEPVSFQEEPLLLSSTESDYVVTYPPEDVMIQAQTVDIIPPSTEEETGTAE